MTLIELFNKFHDACRRINLTSDARSLFLAYMQHWNAQRRPQAVDISLQALRETAKLDDESYRRAAICLSNLKLWRMKRKAHAKDGRFIYIGEFFLDENLNRREVVAESAISASPPTPPSGKEEIFPEKISSSETKTEQSTARELAQEKSPVVDGDFSVETFRDLTFTDVELNPKLSLWLQTRASGDEYNQIFTILRINERKLRRECF